MNNDRTLNFNTTCKTCIFSDLNDGMQVGCTAGKLSKYIEKGKAYKDDKFYVIEGLCQSCRNYEWLKNFDLEISNDELLKKIREENRVTHDLLVLADKDLESFEKTIKSFKDEDNIFDNIYVISTLPSFKEYESVIKNYYNDTKFRIVLDLLNDTKKTIDSVVLKTKSFFFSVVQSGFEANRSYTKSLTKFIVDDINEVSVIHDDGIMTAQVLLYNMLSGQEKPFIEMVEELCEKQSVRMIVEWESISGQ